MKLERHFVEKPWGRRDIAAAFGAPVGKQIGEIWYHSPDAADLPLLVKWLFTSEKLSIQVHPSDAEARHRGLPSGKEECWFIVDAESDAVLGIGTTRPLNAEELSAASLSGAIEGLMDWKTVKRGDFFYIPAGTVHAIGAGVTLVEVQQPADITYRLHDYGRPRELHLDDGVAVSMAKPYDDVRHGSVSGNCRLVDGPYFWLDHVTNVDSFKGVDEHGPYWLIPIAGGIEIDRNTGGIGDCILLPSLSGLTLETGSSFLLAGSM